MHPWPAAGRTAVVLRRVPGIMARWENLKEQVQSPKGRAEGEEGTLMTEIWVQQRFRGAQGKRAQGRGLPSAWRWVLGMFEN